MSEARNLRADAFAGTAEAYLEGRPHYPPALLDTVLAEARPQSPSALLDLASGPGRIALDLAGAFDRVFAVDLEPEMIEAGRREAARRGVGNVAWSVGRAEDFQASAEGFDLITVGEAFHRLDQRTIASRALVWLKPGGCLAALGSAGIMGGGEAWQVRATEIARRWMQHAFPQGWATAREGGATDPPGYEQVLRAAGFVGAYSRTLFAPQTWSLHAVVSHFRSTSVCSARALGEHAAVFERDLLAAMAPFVVDGVLRERAEFGFTVARKPAALDAA